MVVIENRIGAGGIQNISSQARACRVHLNERGRRGIHEDDVPLAVISEIGRCAADSLCHPLSLGVVSVGRRAIVHRDGAVFRVIGVFSSTRREFASAIPSRHRQPTCSTVSVRKDLMGVVGKRKDSCYESGKRSGAWIKYRVNH
jgi:hypothetical protein